MQRHTLEKGPHAGLGNLIGPAASLTFLRLSFPNQVPGIQRWLARAGVITATGVVASAAAEKLQQRRRGEAISPGKRQSFWSQHSQRLKAYHGKHRSPVFVYVRCHRHFAVFHLKLKRLASICIGPLFTGFGLPCA